MKYLVTGAAGFIASRVCHFLLEEGHQVLGVDNLNDYYDVRLKEHRLSHLRAHTGFTFHPLDIEDLPALKALFQKHPFDAVFNLAARAGVRYSMENPFVYFSTNVTGSLNLLECLRQYNVRKLVIASTSSLYAGQSMPFREDMPVNEPISPYAASKKAAEALAYTYHHLYKIDVSVLRYFTVYGPAGRPDMSPLRFIRWIDEGTPIQLFGDGSASRDFTYVDDIARGTILAQREVGYQVMNLGGGNNPITMLEFIHQLETRLGKKAVIDQKPFHSADVQATWADITKAQQLLGWQPQTPLAEGLDRTVAWYRENESFARGLKL